MLKKFPLFIKKLSLPFMLLLANTACTQAVSSQVVPTSTVDSPATTAANLASRDYQLQILKNCDFVKQRALSKEEVALYYKLKNAEMHMTELQAPLDLLEQQLGSQTKLLETMSAQIEQQLAYGDPDPLLLETQSELSEQISEIVDNFEPDLAAVSSQGEKIGELAKNFTQQITKNLAAGSYDQIRILKPGDAMEKNCQQGIFFQKSFTVQQLTKKSETE